MNLTLPGGGIMRLLMPSPPRPAPPPAPQAQPVREVARAAPAPAAAAAAPVSEAATAQEAKERTRRDAQRRTGFPQTITTSGLGVTGDPNVTRRTLLG